MSLAVTGYSIYIEQIGMPAGDEESREGIR